MAQTTTLLENLPQQRQGSPTEFDLEGFLRAMLTKDADAWSDYYAPEAEWLEYRHHNPPRDPRLRLGNVAIHEFLREVCADERHLHVEDLVASDDSVWFRRMVRLGDGRMVIEHVHLRLDGAVIGREIDVESWDYA